MKQAAWLRWVTEKGILTTGFLRDARKSGIMLPVNVQNLSAMSWGDLVYCIGKGLGDPAGRVFCSFPIRQISGMGQEIYDLLLGSAPGHKVLDVGGQFRDKGEDIYLQGATAQVDMSIQEVCACFDRAQRLHLELGDLAIGCEPGEWEVMPMPWPSMLAMSEIPGFRQLDGALFRADLQNYQARTPDEIRLSGRYYASECPNGAGEGRIQWANNYGALPFAEDQLELVLTFSDSAKQN